MTFINIYDVYITLKKTDLVLCCNKKLDRLIYITYDNKSRFSAKVYIFQIQDKDEIRQCFLKNTGNKIRQLLIKLIFR